MFSFFSCLKFLTWTGEWFSIHIISLIPTSKILKRNISEGKTWEEILAILWSRHATTNPCQGLLAVSSGSSCSSSRTLWGASRLLDFSAPQIKVDWLLAQAADHSVYTKTKQAPSLASLRSLYLHRDYSCKANWENDEWQRNDAAITWNSSEQSWIRK